MRFDEDIRSFLRAARQHEVRLLMVGGGAVNFHGYQRHSADIDFWIEPTTDNFDRLLLALRSIGLEVDQLPETVLRSEQNISIKISPELDVELITRFSPGFTFDEAWSRGEEATIADEPVIRYKVMSYDDLIASKIRSARPKDLLDIHELRRVKGL